MNEVIWTLSISIAASVILGLLLFIPYEDGLIDGKTLVISREKPRVTPLGFS